MREKREAAVTKTRTVRTCSPTVNVTGCNNKCVKKVTSYSLTNRICANEGVLRGINHLRCVCYWNIISVWVGTGTPLDVVDYFPPTEQHRYSYSNVID